MKQVSLVPKFEKDSEFIFNEKSFKFSSIALMDQSPSMRRNFLSYSIIVDEPVSESAFSTFVDSLNFQPISITASNAAELLHLARTFEITAIESQIQKLINESEDPSFTVEILKFNMQFNDTSDLEESIISNIDAYIENTCFISLPDQIIHRIVKKSQEKTSSIQIFNLVSNLAKENRYISPLFNLIDIKTLSREQSHELNQIVFSFLFENAILPQNIKNLIELSANEENESLKIENQILTQANRDLIQELDKINELRIENNIKNKEKFDELLSKCKADRELLSRQKKQRNHFFEQLVQFYSSDWNYIKENLIEASSYGDIEIVDILLRIKNLNHFYSNTCKLIGMAIKAAIKENQVKMVNYLLFSNLTGKYIVVS